MDAEAKLIYARVRARMEELEMAWPSGLADEINVSAQRVNNWRHRGIPGRMHARVAEVLDWTVDQLLGKAPPNKDNEPTWPFPSIPAYRFNRLSEGERLAVQGVMVDKIAEIEAERGGKRPRPRHGARTPRAA